MTPDAERLLRECRALMNYVAPEDNPLLSASWAKMKERIDAILSSPPADTRDEALEEAAKIAEDTGGCNRPTCYDCNDDGEACGADDAIAQAIRALKSGGAK